MNLSVFIARRYFLSKKNTNAINILSLISLVVIAVVTMALVVVLSVYNGFEGLIKSLYGAFYPDIQITALTGKVFTPEDEYLQEIENMEEVVFYSEVLEEKALLKYHDKQYIATIKGVDENYLNVTGVKDAIIRGEYKLEYKDQNFAIAGAGIDIALGLYLNSLWDHISVYIPKRTGSISLMPDQAFIKQSINPSGVFSIQQDFDTKYLIVPLRFARKMLKYKEEASAIEIKLKPGVDIPLVQEKLRSILGKDFHIKNRYEQNMALYKLMKTERWATYLILSLILLIASFNIVGSLSMLVIEKKKDMAVLKSMGAEGSLIQKIFLIEGMIICTGGAVIGGSLGALICFVQQQFGIVRIAGSGTFVVDSYPVIMHFNDFLLVFVTVLIISLLASWYPARQAALTKAVWKEG